MQTGSEAVSTDADTSKVAEEPPVAAVERRSLFGRLGSLLKGEAEGELLTPGPDPVALQTPVRITWTSGPFQLTLGNMSLELHPDLAVSGDEIGGDREWIVHAGRSYYKGVPRFVRVVPGEPLILGRSDELQKKMFGLNKSVAGRHVRMDNRKGELTIQPLDSDRLTEVSTIESGTPVWEARRKNLKRLPNVLGRPVVEFDDKEALKVVREVNAILAKEPYRERDDEGAPGGIVRIPDAMTAIILGDIHARTDNLLRVLSEGAMLGALEKDQACLVFLGDLVHSQEAGELEDMSSSVLALDLFCMLKLRFPKNVFYIRGNHESFSPDVGKGGVPQGQLFAKLLKQRRGKAYLSEIETLFEALAFVVQGNDFAACHGAPVRSRVDRGTLVNIRRYPGVQYELVWNRLRQGNRPAGYGKGSVKRFRQTLSLSKHAPVIVAHTPLSLQETAWFDIGGITGHHLVYSAHTDRLAAMLVADGELETLEFVPEQALAFLAEQQNKRADS